ncbi:MAG TPA: DNA polymerase III subunit alpha [Thermoanaerobaculia bacterium]|nr:DNA polymerase III subunit alpha [Thermoanaerobaculia bacterium]
MPSFVHLHLHSQYSLLDGANRLDDVLNEAKQLGMPALALTDHGNMFGAIEFYDRARSIGVKPIIGIEAYVAQGSRLERKPGAGSSNHLVLLARNETGYRNLIKLTSRSYLEGFYYKPRIDKELLRRYSEGLIGMSACLKGEVNEKILSRREDEAKAAAIEFREILGDDNFYLELQDHGIPEQRQANEILRRISRDTGIPLVISNDTHYLKSGDAFAHDVLLCIGTQRTIDDPNRLRYASKEFYLKSGEEMAKLFPQDHGALENTLAIAERCQIEIATGTFHLPEFPVPPGETLDSFLENLAREGLERRLEELGRAGRGGLAQPREIYEERLRQELQIIESMGFSGYFLVVWDFIRYAREEDIPVGPGRGSAAGSLVSYALRITDIDPLRYDLLFERFLNPERISMPDIDIDFCMRRRGDVIQYVNEKYGRDRVAQIITFGTLAAKAVIRDVGRVLGLPYAKVDRVAKLLPDMTRSLAAAAEEVPALAAEVAQDSEIKQVVEVGSRLEGLTRHASLHAAGVVIAPRPIDELVPLYKTSKDEIVTQWDKDVIEKLGLLKMDFLGLRTLTVVDDALKTLRLQGVDLDLDQVPLDDPETFKLFSEARTSGIFQFESGGMRDLLRRGKPSRFEDLAAFNALYRPGALSVGMVEEYLKRKLGKKKIRYVLPETEPILAETYGVIVYQEQVMRIAVEVAGFSLGQADLLRKAMGKKNVEVMNEQKEKFISGASARGVAKAKANELWDYIAPFAGYGFNKSHSVAYAMLAYKTAYLKAHYPLAFMAAMLTSEMGSKDNVSKYIQECREMGIAVLPPDVNQSNWSFTVVDDTIRFGLGAVKGLGESAVEAILAARNRIGAFRGLAQFGQEVDLRAINHKVFECLIKSGSFDAFGLSRRALYEGLDHALALAQRRQRERDEGQGNLFSGASAAEPAIEDRPEWADAERLSYEKEALGFYLTGNPLKEHEPELEALTSHTTQSLKDGVEGRATVGGLVAHMKRIKIKSGPNAGKLMGRFVLEDLEGSVPVAIFSNTLEKYGHLLEDEAVVVVRGSVRVRGSDVELTGEEITSLRKASQRLLTGVEVTLARGITTGDMLRLRDLLIEHPGDVPVTIRLESEGRAISIAPEDRFRVCLDEGLAQSIAAIIGEGNLRQHYVTEIASS